MKTSHLNRITSGIFNITKGSSFIVNVRDIISSEQCGWMVRFMKMDSRKIGYR